MPLLVTTAGIDAIIQALAPRPNTLKFRLLQALRQRLADNATIEATTAISADELIAEVWQLDDPAAIKAKRKNFSSLKSALNRDLARLEKEGKNPESLVLGRNNVFEVSGRKKEELIRSMGISSGADTELAAQFAEFRREFSEIAKERGWNRLQDLLNEIEQTRQRLQELEQRLAQEPKEDKNESEAASVGKDVPAEGLGEAEEAAGLLGEEEEEEKETEVLEIDDDQQIVLTDDLPDEHEEDEDEADEIIEVDEDQELAPVTDDQLPAGEAAQPGDLEDADLPDGSLEMEEEEEKEEEEEEEVLEIDDDQQIVLADDLPEEHEEDEDEADEIIEVDEDQELAPVTDEQLSAGEAAHPGDLADADLPDSSLEMEEVEEEEEEVLEIDDDQQIVLADDLPEEEEDQPDEIIEIDEDQQLAPVTDDQRLAEQPDQPGGMSSDDDAAASLEEEEEEEETEEEVLEIDDEQQIVLADDVPDEDEKDEDQADEIIEVDEAQELAPIDEARERRRPRNLFDALAEYLDPDQALADETQDTLDETEEEYLAKLLSRFTPRFIAIPAGRYRVGSDRPGPFERPAEWVELPAFHIGQTPVTNDLFDLFVRETGYVTQAEEEGFGIVFHGRFQEAHTSGGRRIFRLGGGRQMTRVAGADWRHPEGPQSSIIGRHDHPVVQVSRRDALAFAAWAGKRLPSEEEWEAAIRGRQALPYPWGETWREDAATVESSLAGATTPVTAHHPQGASPFGVLDGIGNVYEWTGSLWRAAGGQRVLAILKGGAWLTPPPVPAWHRLVEDENFRANTVGFRCAV